MLAFSTRIPDAVHAMAAAILQLRKQPRQARSTSTVEAILIAAARILAADSLAGFNTNRVADVAGVSVGSLYQYFPNKSALVAALIEREQDRLASAVETCVHAHRGRDLKATLAALIDIAIEHQFGNPVFAAALDHEERRLPVMAVLDRTRHRLGAAVTEVLHRHRDELGSRLPAKAAQDCLVIVKALVEAEDPSCPRADLKRRALRAVIGYLQHR